MAVILLDLFPRAKELIFSTEDFARLEKLGRVALYPEAKVPDSFIEEHLPEAVALIGQSAMPKERLDRAPKLKAICNVEGNFLPNVDYDECHRRNIHVLSCAPAFAPAVAELALGLALACARGIVEADGLFRAGAEAYGGSGNQQSWILRGKPLGLIGCGNVGRALIPLLKPFGGELLVHDPWVNPRILKDLGLVPVELDELLRRAQAVFVMAAATTENKKGLGAEHFRRMPQGSALILVGRSDVLDFDALLDAAQAGHLKAAIDVFPEEPLAKDHRARRTPNTILSAHRAGGLPETYKEIGRMAVDDLEWVLRGLAPQRMQKAVPETVGRYRGKPVSGPGK